MTRLMGEASLFWVFFCSLFVCLFVFGWWWMVRWVCGCGFLGFLFFFGGGGRWLVVVWL